MFYSKKNKKKGQIQCEVKSVFRFLRRRTVAGFQLFPLWNSCEKDVECKITPILIGELKYPDSLS